MRGFLVRVGIDQAHGGWNAGGASFAVELGSRFNNHGHAKDQLFDYIEVFYNQQRRHSALDYVSPAEYERAARVRQAA